MTNNSIIVIKYYFDIVKTWSPWCDVILLLVIPVVSDIISIFLSIKNNLFIIVGDNVNIKEITEFSLMFNYPDTLGNILGFKNTGQDFAIYDFASQISNFDSYNNTNNLDSVGNINTSNNLMNFSGNYNYMLMYLNDIEYIYIVLIYHLHLQKYY